MSNLAFAAHLSERAATAGVALSPENIEALERYYRLLERWNLRINLTALSLAQHPSETIDRLIVEPLAAAEQLSDGPLEWVDLGSGGGSPAIPLKIVRPRWRLLMTESRGRKAAFLREAVRDLGLVDAAVLSDRFETLAQGAGGTADLITARAVKVDKALSELVRHVLKPQGRLLVFGYQDSPWLSGFDAPETGILPGSSSRFGLLTKR